MPFLLGTDRRGTGKPNDLVRDGRLVAPKRQPQPGRAFGRKDQPIVFLGCAGGALRRDALAETINGLYKAEVIHRRGPWRSMEAVEFATLEWVDWFKNRRLLKPIGNIPPAEREASYCASMETPAMAALLKPNSLRQTRGGSILGSERCKT